MLAKNLICTLAAGLALTCVSSTRAADVDPLLPDDSEVVVTVNVKQILGSNLIKKYALDQMKQALESDRAKDVFGPLGLDPLKDVSTVVLAGPGGDEPGKACIIIRGNFDVDKLRASAEKQAKKDENLKIVKEGEHTLYEVKNPRGGRNPLGDTMYMAIAGADAIVASPTKDYVTAALNKKSGGKAKINKKLAAILKSADGNQSLFLAVLADGFKKSELARDEKVKELLDKVEAMSVGLTVGDDIKLNSSVSAKNAAAAGDLKKQLEEGVDQAKALVGVLALNNPDIAPLADILNTFKVKTAEAKVTLNGAISAKVIENAIKRGRRN